MTVRLTAAEWIDWYNAIHLLGEIGTSHALSTTPHVLGAPTGTVTT